MDETKQNIQSEIDRLNNSLKENEELLDSLDEELKLLAQDEAKNIQNQIANLEKTLKSLDSDYTGSESEDGEETGNGATLNTDAAILEVRAGTGGDEAAIFAADLYHMYMRYAENNHIKVEEYFRSENTSGGIKTVTARLKGENIYHLLKNESGVHRVQRVPVTEASGRIHTSTATVAVLPEVKKIDIEINPEDLQWEFFRSGGKGGQNVNKVSTAVRLIHVPTQVIVECQEERTQGRNREKALGILQSRIYTMMQEQQVKSITDVRSQQVGTGERSEKIRTYNFPQDRLTDHRINKNWHNLPNIMNGDIQEILETQTQENTNEG